MVGHRDMMCSAKALGKNILATTIDQQCALLYLPGEIRSRIWRMALRSTVIYTKAHPTVKLPPVSLACKQTLQETIGLHLADTRMEIHIRDYDSAFIVVCGGSHLRLRVLAEALGQRIRSSSDSAIQVLCYGVPSWTNLMTYARADHEYVKECGFPFVGAPEPEDDDVFTTIINTERALSRWDWADIEPFLRNLRGMAKHCDARWG